MNLETKIPPPAICFICALLMYISAQVSALADILPRFPILLSVVFMVFGTLLSVLGVWAFRRVRTTVSPFNPEQTEHFVSDGVYRFSRNPMYAGMGCWLVAWAGYMAHPLPWLFLAAFVAYMTRFQIMPEERVLAQNTSLTVGAFAVGYKSGSFPSSIIRLLLYGINVNTRCFQTTPIAPQEMKRTPHDLPAPKIPA